MWVFALWVFPIVGCHEVSTPTTAPLSLSATGWDAEAESEVRLEGVELCEIDTTNCMLSNANGEVTIELPIGEAGYTLEREGYADYVVANVMPQNGREYPFYLEQDQWMVAQHQLVMAQYPMSGTGTIEIGIFPNSAGVTLTLIDATGKPYYVDEEGNWSLDLTSTTSFGWGGFVSVPPGEFQVKVGGTAQRCVSDWGWPREADNTFAFPGREGRVAVVIIDCPLPL